MSRDRALRAMRLGARRLDVAKWRGLVEEAALLLSRHRTRAFTSFNSLDEAAQHPLKARPVYILPTQVVVGAQLLLDLERALAEAEMLRVELGQLAVEEIEEARAWKLRRVLDQAIANVQQRLAREQSENPPPPKEPDAEDR